MSQGICPTFDVPVDDFLVVQILESLKNLLGVASHGGLVLLQRAPLGAQQRREAATGHLININSHTSVP